MRQEGFLKDIQDDLADRDAARLEIHGKKVVLIGSQEQIKKAESFVLDAMKQHSVHEEKRDYRHQIHFLRYKFSVNDQPRTIIEMLREKFPGMKVFVHMANQATSDKFPMSQHPVLQTVSLKGNL